MGKAPAAPWWTPDKQYLGRQAFSPWTPKSPDSQLVILSYGMGVESTAILVRWLLDPSSRVIKGKSFELENLVVLTAMTGNEKKVTGQLVDKFVLPLLRKHNVRFIQAARKGHMKQNGYVVLDDSRQPQRTFVEGSYSLGEDMRAAGTVIQSRENARTCSQNFKAVVLEDVIYQVAGGHPYAHVMGYSANEESRRDTDLTFRQAGHKSEHPLFTWGEHVEEKIMGPKGKLTRKRDMMTSFALVPGLSREGAQGYLYSIFGPLDETYNGLWPKSACTFCPFALKVGLATGERESEEILHHWLDNYDEFFEAMDMEYESLCFNELQPLKVTIRLTEYLQRLQTFDFSDALAAWRAERDKQEHRIYRVQRFKEANTSLGRDGVEKTTVSAYRSLRQIETFDDLTMVGTRAQMLDTLKVIAARLNNTVITDEVTGRITIRDIATGVSEQIVVAPVGADSKERVSFRAKYNHLTGSGDQDFLIRTDDHVVTPEITLAAPTLV